MSTEKAADLPPLPESLLETVREANRTHNDHYATRLILAAREDQLRGALHHISIQDRLAALLKPQGETPEGGRKAMELLPHDFATSMESSFLTLAECSYCGVSAASLAAAGSCSRRASLPPSEPVSPQPQPERPDVADLRRAACLKYLEILDRPQLMKAYRELAAEYYHLERKVLAVSPQPQAEENMVTIDTHILCNEEMGKRGHDPLWVCPLEKNHRRPHITLTGLEWRTFDQQANFELQAHLKQADLSEQARLEIAAELKSRSVSESPLPGREAQEERLWLLMFDDADRGYSLYHSESEALAAYATARVGWSCTLFYPAPQLPVRPEDEDSDVIIPGNEYRALLHDQAGYRALLEVLEDLRKFTAPPKAGK